MKLAPRTLALRAEQKLEMHIPKHIVKVTYNSFSGVKIRCIIGSSIRTYSAGLSWTEIDQVTNTIIKDYVAAKYPKEECD